MMASITGTLLAVDLSAASANFAAGFGTLGALAPTGRLGTEDQGRGGDVDLSTEHGFAQFDFADGRTFLIV